MIKCWVNRGNTCGRPTVSRRKKKPSINGGFYSTSMGQFSVHSSVMNVQHVWGVYASMLIQFEYLVILYDIYIYISSIIYTIYNKYLIHTHTYGGVYTIYLYIAMAEAVFFASPLRNSRTGWTNSWKAGRANWNPWSWKCLGPRKRQCFSSSPGHPDSFVKVLFCVKNLKSRLHTHFKSFHREFYTLYICIH